MPTVQEALERNITALNARDLAAYLANQRPDVEFTLPGGVQLRGRDAVAGYMQAMWTAFPDGVIAFTSTLLSDSGAAVEIEFTGTHTGPLASPEGTIPPTGRKVRLQSASILQIRDGLIASEHVYLDPAQMAAQLGLAGDVDTPDAPSATSA
jgi:predicted ester cyclase